MEKLEGLREALKSFPLTFGGMSPAEALFTYELGQEEGEPECSTD